MSSLPHTDAIAELLRLAKIRQEAGDVREANELRQTAQRIHNDHVAAELERAKSEPINLSDLMGAKEEFLTQ
jgi:hypothetical protein